MDRILSTGFMKEMEDKNLRSLLASQPFKKMVTQLLVSVSIFSLVFSWPSLCLTSPLTYCEKLYCFSWNSLQLLSVATNKNCIFLICNGILVFVAKTSPVVPSPPPSDPNDMLQKTIGDADADRLQIQMESEPVFDKHIMLEENVAGEEEAEEQKIKWNEEDGGLESCSNEGTEEVSISIDESDEEGGLNGHEDVGNDEGEPENCFHFDEDENDNDEEQQVDAEDKEEDGIEKLSTEELNQKFEDFIRRMKEEFRISEAQQRLVMVN